jgi:hypothetical protein
VITRRRSGRSRRAGSGWKQTVASVGEHAAEAMHREVCGSLIGAACRGPARSGGQMSALDREAGLLAYGRRLQSGRDPGPAND